MERKIGEIFEYEGKKLKVVETEKNLCFDCYFYNGLNCQKTFRECGKCGKGARSDYKPIIFVEVKEESKEKPQKNEEIKSGRLGRFDPKTLKPFDRVLSKYDGGCWSANLFSHIEEENNKYHVTCSFVCNGSLVRFCIPYNDDTKHLVGTTDEAPDFYRYWED